MLKLNGRNSHQRAASASTGAISAKRRSMTPEKSAAERSPATRDGTSMGGAGLSGAAGVPAREPNASADRRSAKKSCNLDNGIALPGADTRTLDDRIGPNRRSLSFMERRNGIRFSRVSGPRGARREGLVMNRHLVVRWKRTESVSRNAASILN